MDYCALRPNRFCDCLGGHNLPESSVTLCKFTDHLLRHEFFSDANWERVEKNIDTEGTDMNFFQGLGPFGFPGLFILSKHDATHGKPSHLPVTERPPHIFQPVQRSLHRSIWPQGLASQEEASRWSNNERKTGRKLSSVHTWGRQGWSIRTPA